METLAQYLERTGTTEAAFADAVGLSRMSVSRIKHGRQWPSRKTAQRIAQVTGGAVKFDPLEMGAAS